MMSLPDLQPWHWLVLAAILGVLEILVPGAVLIWFALSAACMAGLLFLLPDLAEGWQVLIFAGLGAAWLAAAMIWRRRRAGDEADAPVNIGAARLIGQRGVLETDLRNGRGEMRLGDTVWPVSGPDLPAGSNVVVEAAEGALLIVRPS